MSLNAISWVTEQRCGSPTRKAVLMSIATFCYKDNMVCRPFQATIAERAELSLRATKTAIKELQEMGFIRKEGNSYLLNPSQEVHHVHSAPPCESAARAPEVQDVHFQEDQEVQDVHSQSAPRAPQSAARALATETGIETGSETGSIPAPPPNAIMAIPVESPKPAKLTPKLTGPTLDELGIDHIAEWLNRKRALGRYLLIDEDALLEKFKNYCLSKGPNYKNYIAAFKNSFDWPNAPTKGSKNGKYTADDALREALAEYGDSAQRPDNSPCPPVLCDTGHLWEDPRPAENPHGGVGGRFIALSS